MLLLFAVLLGLGGAGPSSASSMIVDVRASPPSVSTLPPGVAPRRLRGRVETAGAALRDGGDVVDDLIPGLPLTGMRDGGAPGHWVVDGSTPTLSGFGVIIDTAADRSIVAPSWHAVSGCRCGRAPR